MLIDAIYGTLFNNNNGDRKCSPITKALLIKPTSMVFDKTQYDKQSGCSVDTQVVFQESNIAYLHRAIVQ